MTGMAPQSTALLYLDASEVASLCQAIDPLAVVTGAFAAVAAGRAGVTDEAALRWTAPDGTAARSLVLPAWHGDSYGCKIINACIGNVDRGLPRAQGLIMLFDPGTAAPVAVLEGALISALRTAAVSLAAVRAVRDLGAFGHVAFLGCGRQARTHLELLAARAAPEAVTGFDAEPARAAAFTDYAGTLLPAAKTGTAASPEDAVRAADLIIAATTTTTPYVRIGWLRAGAVFVNVSLDDATEELLLGCEHLVVDDWPLVSHDTTRLLGRLAQAGKVTGPREPPVPGSRKVDADLAGLLSGARPAQAGPADRVVINPFGMGVHDIALAAQVYAAALERDRGIRLAR
jgi:ornithine cyclodeaminase/alanine dehydrogenase-like protein (mu-crystallin family)